MYTNPFIKAIKRNFHSYFSASLFSAVFGMLMNKYYTNVFSVEDFGVLSLYLTFIAYLQNFIACTFENSWARCYFDYRSQRRKFFGTIFVFSIGSILVFSFVILCNMDIVTYYIAGNRFLVAFSLLAAIVGLYIKFVNQLSILENCSQLVRNQTILQSILAQVFSVIFIFCGVGIAGRLWGNICGGVLNAYYYTKALYSKGFLSLTVVFVKSIFTDIKPFAVSSFFTLFITTTLSYADRVLLVQYHGAANVGVYTIGMYIGQAMSLVIEAVSAAIFPTIINGLKDDYNTKILELKKFDIYWLLFLIGCFLCICFSKDVLILIFSNGNYLGATNVIPMIALGYVAGAMYKNVSGVLSYHKKVWFYPFVAVISYSVSLLLNLLLIPEYAEVGAAFAFFIGASIYSLLIHCVGHEFYFRFREFIWLYIGIFFTGWLIFQYSV